MNVKNLQEKKQMLSGDFIFMLDEKFKKVTSYLRQFFQCARSAHFLISNTVSVLEAPPTPIKFSVQESA